MNNTPEILEFEVGPDLDGMRLDLAVAAQYPDISRSQAKKLIAAGKVLVGGVPEKAKRIVKEGERVRVEFSPTEEGGPSAEPIPLDVLFEDDQLIVVNKPPGMVVHPGAGNPSGTLVNALLHHCPELEGVGALHRPGIVHRLDKETSGILVVAKNAAAHAALADQMERRTASRRYNALTLGTFEEDTGTVDAPIGRSSRDRKKMSVLGAGPREAVTHFRVLERFFRVAMHLEIRLQTGRTHQIRVHLAHVSRPVLGDPTYGHAKHLRRNLEAALGGPLRPERQMLHACALSFDHPVTGQRLEFEADPPEDFQSVLSILRGLNTP